jgi:Asp-tRNA(Asn)/Glu-tRNA(Gln) amidotransferase A subunit family amidase
VGIFARSIEDAALVEWLMGPDDVDLDTKQSPGPLSATAASEPPVTPDLAYARTPFWDRADGETQAAFGELQEALGSHLEAIELPEVFARGVGWLEAIMTAEMARNLGHYVDRSPDQVSDRFRQLIEDGRAMKAVDYQGARDMRQVLRDSLKLVFEHFDAIVTLSAPGEAPQSLDTTGDPIFCSLWTFCGLPAISLPLLTGPNGMPVGVQLVGAPGQDARLLRTARWLVRTLSEEGEQ